MKQKLITLSVCLLIASTLMCQTGLTSYPFSESQVRTMGMLKIEYTFLLDENKTLMEMLMLCDSVIGADDIAFVEMNNIISAKQNMLNNREEKYSLIETKFMLMEEQIKKERKRKHLYFSTTFVALALLTISLFN